MIVFELVHTYFTFKNSIFYSLRSLGFYLNMQDTEEAISFYRDLPGFCDAPNGFSIRRRSITGNVVENTFFEALVYAHTYGYEDYEFTAELGLFASKVDAQNAIDTYRLDNKQYYGNESIEIEEIINKHNISDRYCTEGFVVEILDN